MKESDIEFALKDVKDEDRPKSRHYVMILAVLVILAVVVSVIVLNFMQKGDINFLSGNSDTPPTFPSDNTDTGSSSDSGSAEGPPPLPDFPDFE